MHIAITGRMGSGKSSVSKYLRDLGYRVYDADEIAKNLLESATVKAQLVNIFGASVLTCMGEIDHAYLSFRIFNHASEKRRVEAVIHPLVYQTLNELYAKTPHDLVFSEVPLLFESHGQAHFDRSLLISSTEERALERLMLQRNFTREQAQARLNTQMSLEEKRALATDEIENNDSYEMLKEKVIQYLHTLTKKV